MFRFNVLVGLVVIAILFGGCKKEEPAPPPPSTSGEETSTVPPAPAEVTPPSVPETPEAVPVPPPPGPSPQAVEEAKAKLAAVQAAIKDGKLDQAEADLKDLEAMKDLPADMQNQIKQARVALDGAKLAKANTEAESLLAKILAWIKDGKLDDAEKALAALEAKKGSLPQSLQDRIAGARKALDAAKALQKPAIPKLPG